MSYVARGKSTKNIEYVARHQNKMQATLVAATLRVNRYCIEYVTLLGVASPQFHLA